MGIIMQRTITTCWRGIITLSPFIIHQYNIIYILGYYKHLKGYPPNFDVVCLMWYNKVKLTHCVCNVSLFLTIYMFILIRMGKDRKDRDWILCKVYKFLVKFINSTLGGVIKTEKKMALSFIAVPMKSSPHLSSPTFYLYFS